MMCGLDRGCICSAGDNFGLAVLWIRLWMHFFAFFSFVLINSPSWLKKSWLFLQKTVNNLAPTITFLVSFTDLKKPQPADLLFLWSFCRSRHAVFNLNPGLHHISNISTQLVALVMNHWQIYNFGYQIKTLGVQFCGISINLPPMKRKRNNTDAYSKHALKRKRRLFFITNKKKEASR